MEASSLCAQASCASVLRMRSSSFAPGSSGRQREALSLTIASAYAVGDTILRAGRWTSTLLNARALCPNVLEAVAAGLSRIARCDGETGAERAALNAPGPALIVSCPALNPGVLEAVAAPLHCIARCDGESGVEKAASGASSAQHMPNDSRKTPMHLISHTSLFVGEPDATPAGSALRCFFRPRTFHACLLSSVSRGR